MKPITYLCFTLLSIVIQFCLMDFINEQRGIDDGLSGMNIPIEKNLSAVFKDLKEKPHALYYKVNTKTQELKEKNKSVIKYINSTVGETSLWTSTELASTVFDLVYDENVSISDSDSTTETPYTNSEFDNVTEIPFFDKKSSTNKPKNTPVKTSTNLCYCNLLYKTCDINCCCDSDCSDLEKSLMKKCGENANEKCFGGHDGEYLYMCSSQLSCNKHLQNDLFAYLFCIGKVNKPQKITKTTVQLNISENHISLKWHVTKRKPLNNKFSKNVYFIGKRVLMVTNGTIDFLRLPITITNEYCNGYKAVKFLIDESIKCYVKLEDMYMLHILKTSETTNIASPREETFNSTKMDCTTLHCVKLIFVVCNEYNCTQYKNDIHEPSCSEYYCNNIATRIEYEFYCNASIITSAFVKFHVRKISMASQFVTQQININFYMGNNSIDNIVKLSGNPGYIKGLPIIISVAESNHTENFFNGTFNKRNYILPFNKDGNCVLTNLTHNVLKFGHNKRMKCRALFTDNFAKNNGTQACLNIQRKIDELYGLNDNVYISPYGNPHGVTDDNWISMKKVNSHTYGENLKDSKLNCYNLCVRIGFVIKFVDINEVNREDNKILGVNVESTAKNVSFHVEDLSTVLTIDVVFIDAGKPMHDPLHSKLFFV